MQLIHRNLDLKITKGEFNILQKLLTSWASVTKHCWKPSPGTDKSKSLLVIQIQEAIGENKQPKSLLSRKEEVYVLKEDKENVLDSHQRANNADQK